MLNVLMKCLLNLCQKRSFVVTCDLYKGKLSGGVCIDKLKVGQGHIDYRKTSIHYVYYLLV